MANDKNNSIWPLPKFYFSVDFGTEITDVHFQEVSGLDTKVQPIEYRAENSKLMSTIKMPTIPKNDPITKSAIISG